MNDPQSPQNQAELRKRLEARAKLEGLQVGAWVLFKNGRQSRIAYIECNGGNEMIQDATVGSGAFYLSAGGREEYAGECRFHAFDAERLIRLASHRKQGVVWFCDQDNPGAGAPVYFHIDEPVYLFEEE